MEYPPISCKCSTYGRTFLLEESLQSFLKQEYPGKKELIIVNDYPEQKLFFDHPDVKIYNFDKPFDTLGEKENFAVSQCSYDIIAVWDDDDVALPNHLSNIGKYFIDGSDLLHWQKGVMFNEPNDLKILPIGNSGIVFSRHIFNKIGGYPKGDWGYDMGLVIDIKKISKNIVLASPPDNEVSWIYMWGGRTYHLSGYDGKNKNDVISSYRDHINDLKNKGEIPIGDVTLKPRWKKDYFKLLQNHIKTNSVDYMREKIKNLHRKR
jgi:hypothetical protein